MLPHLQEVKWLPLEDFPVGSGQCEPDRRLMQNMPHAAKSQNKPAWWNEVQADQTKLARVSEAYEHRRPKVGNKPRASFPIANFSEEIRQERQILTG